MAIATYENALDLLAGKLLEDESHLGVEFPYVTDESGAWRFLDIAHERMQLVAQRARDGNTHDIGFIFESSAIPAYRVTGESAYATVALEAADRLRRRLITTRKGAYLSAWGPLDDNRGRRSSAIDTMANL